MKTSKLLLIFGWVFFALSLIFAAMDNAILHGSAFVVSQLDFTAALVCMEVEKTKQPEQ